MGKDNPSINPGEFALMANAHALEEGCRSIVEEMINQGGAKAIAVASSYGDGSERAFLDSPKAEWLWEFAAANDIVVHIHPPMLSVGHEVLMQYSLNEAVGRPFDSTVNGTRMIGSGAFDRHPKLQVLIVHLPGELPWSCRQGTPLPGFLLKYHISPSMDGCPPSLALRRRAYEHACGPS
jgi:predicted TIM-barrel fold metal-dependent hydrolase